MTRKLNYITFNSSMGWVGILASEKGLLSVTLPQRSVQEVRRLLGNNVMQATRSSHLFDDLVERLKIYFSGHQATFPDELDLSAATAFQHEVWEAAILIPYSETRSYTWVAEQIKRPKAVQAVGQALGKNPLPIIIPCHRVIASNGRLGGFTGGLEMKKQLLSLEAENIK